jgi:hypothetical protein
MGMESKKLADVAARHTATTNKGACGFAPDVGPVVCERERRAYVPENHSASRASSMQKDACVRAA